MSRLVHVILRRVGVLDLMQPGSLAAISFGKTTLSETWAVRCVLRGSH